MTERKLRVTMLGNGRLETRTMSRGLCMMPIIWGGRQTGRNNSNTETDSLVKKLPCQHTGKNTHLLDCIYNATWVRGLLPAWGGWTCVSINMTFRKQTKKIVGLWFSLPSKPPRTWHSRKNETIQNVERECKATCTVILEEGSKELCNGEER